MLRILAHIGETASRRCGLGLKQKIVGLVDVWSTAERNILKCGESLKNIPRFTFTVEEPRATSSMCTVRAHSGCICCALQKFNNSMSANKNLPTPRRIRQALGSSDQRRPDLYKGTEHVISLSYTRLPELPPKGAAVQIPFNFIDVVFQTTSRNKDDQLHTE